MASSIANLKSHIKTLNQIFNSNHERFQVLHSNVDEIQFRFFGKNEKHYDINVCITEVYPALPPIWYVETEEEQITKTIAMLNNTVGSDNHLINQIKILLSELCELLDVPMPSTFSELNKYIVTSDADKKNVVPSVDNEQESVEHEEANENENFEDDLPFEIDVNDCYGNKDDDVEVDDKMKDIEKIVFEKLQKRRNSSSTQSSMRILKELREIYGCDSYKSGMYSVEYNDDNIYEWKIKLKQFDEDSPLQNDLKILKALEDEDGILLSMTFGHNYPFEPPFVRVLYPMLTGGYVMSGGAICMELLTKDGWSSAYTVEAIIIQIAATLVFGKVRIKFGLTKAAIQSQYNLSHAQRNFNLAASTHRKFGW